MLCVYTLEVSPRTGNARAQIIKRRMAGAQGPVRDVWAACLMDLPEPILQHVVAHLDAQSLCKVAQTCRLLLRLAGKQCMQMIPCLVALEPSMKQPMDSFAGFFRQGRHLAPPSQHSARYGTSHLGFQIEVQWQVIDCALALYRG